MRYANIEVKTVVTREFGNYFSFIVIEDGGDEGKAIYNGGGVLNPETREFLNLRTNEIVQEDGMRYLRDDNNIFWRKKLRVTDLPQLLIAKKAGLKIPDEALERGAKMYHSALKKPVAA
jgi:hypothetical protein